MSDVRKCARCGLITLRPGAAPPGLSEQDLSRALITAKGNEESLRASLDACRFAMTECAWALRTLLASDGGKDLDGAEDDRIQRALDLAEGRKSERAS